MSRLFAVRGVPACRARFYGQGVTRQVGDRSGAEADPASRQARHRRVLPDRRAVTGWPLGLPRWLMVAAHLAVAEAAVARHRQRPVALHTAATALGAANRVAHHITTPGSPDRGHERRRLPPPDPLILITCHHPPLPLHPGPGWAAPAFPCPLPALIPALVLRHSFSASLSAEPGCKPPAQPRVPAGRRSAVVSWPDGYCQAMTGDSAALLLGIDAGGTSVDAVAARSDGTVIGTGHAGAGNPLALPLETVTRHLAEAVMNALSGIDPARVASAVLGVAGVARFAHPDWTRALHGLWRDCGLRTGVRLVADPVVAFAAGTPARCGAVLIGGTGAIAAAICDAAVTSRVDGHGWLVGDDGSGFWLGRQAVRAVLSELDGRGEPTALRYAVLATMTGCDEMPAAASEQLDLLRTAVYDGPPIGLARLAALVPAAADAGDRVAQRIIDRAVALLTDTVDALLAGAPAEFGGTGDGHQPIGPSRPLVLAGSVLTSPGPIQREVGRRITARYGSAPLIAGSGAGAAAWLAARRCQAPGAGAGTGEEIHRRLTASVVTQPGPAGPAAGLTGVSNRRRSRRLRRCYSRRRSFEPGRVRRRR